MRRRILGVILAVSLTSMQFSGTAAATPPTTTPSTTAPPTSAPPTTSARPTTTATPTPTAATTATTTPARSAEVRQPSHVLVAHANFVPASGDSRPAAVSPKAVAPPQAPFTECPAVGADTSCGVLIQVSDSGASVFSDPSQGPYDGNDDTLTGVVNASSKPVQSIALSSDTDLFGFDGDGLCTFSFAQSAGCPYGPTGYEGPNTSFSGITPDESGGVVNFPTPLAPGATAYFTLEEALTASGVFSGGPGAGEQGGAPNPSEHVTVCYAAQPVNCATGDFLHTFTDFDIPGRGAALDFNRTYSTAASATDGPLGFGWTDSYDMSLAVDAAGNVSVMQEDGSTVPFVPNGSGGYTAPPRVLASLASHPDGTFTFTRLANQVRYAFSATGQLLSETDLNGNTTTLAYNGALLASVTDSAGRKLTFTYAGTQIAQITDPLGRTVSYTYDVAGDLSQTTDPAGRTWKFTYDSGHKLLTMTDPRNGTLTNTYDASSRVVQQVDADGLKTTWSYAGDAASPGGGTTTMTDPHGNVTVYNYANLELLSITHGSGTSAAATTSYTYDPATLGRTTVTDPNGHVTTNTYDHDGNLLSTTDPLGNKTSYGYNGFDELTSKTTPAGETTTLAYDANGNLLSATDPLGNNTTYAYADGAHPGDVTSVTDPGSRVETMTYDTDGDQASVTTSPAAGVSDTTEITYDADGERVCSTSPDATASGVSCPAAGAARVADTTTWSYDADSEVISTTDPAGHTTATTYDGDGNVVGTTDPLGNATTTTYDADNRTLKVTTGVNGPSPSTTTNAYDLAPGTAPCGSAVAGATYCTTNTDPNGHTTVDFFSARDQLLEEILPGGQITMHTYDLAGNQTTLVDAAGRITTSSYDADNRLTAITYSDGTTPNVGYTYDADSRRISMTDGTGTTTYAYDGDSRPTSVANGAASTVAYAYDSSGDVTTLTYPGGGTVAHTFDGAGRLSSVTDPANHTTTFAYDANGNVTSTAYPNGDTVASTYDPANALTATQVAPTASPGSPLASLADSRNADEQLTQETAAGGLSGSTSYSYNAKVQLAAANGSTFSYDLAGNPTALGSTVSQTFDSDSEVTSATAGGATTTYGDDAVGNRTLTTAANGATTAYTYDQANRLTSATATIPVPVVSMLSPTSGPAAGGTTVTITGTGFTGATAVSFGSQAAKFSVTSDTAITATSPPGSSTVDVTVTTPGGSSVAGSADQFTYISGPQPAVSFIAPNIGPATGGFSVLIAGVNLAKATAVHFGTRSVPFHQVLELSFLPNLILATAPAGTGMVNVTVTTPNGTSAANNADRFTYISAHGGARATPAASSPSVAPAVSIPVASYTYNGDGLRATKKTSTGTESFTWDVATSPALLLVDGITTFIYGPDGMAIEQIDGSGNASYYFHDQLGSTRALLGSTGALTATYTYNPYGQVTATSGTAHTPLTYAGGYNDSETGFIYLRARYYDPATGQFLSRDPFAAITLSPYGYVGDNPLNGVDPYGLFCFSLHCVLKDVGIATAVIGGVAALTVLCIATACAADAAILIGGATDLASELAFEETVGAIAGYAATGSTIVGLVAGGADAFYTCEQAGFTSSDCLDAIADFGEDAVFAAIGHGLEDPVFDFLDSLRGIANGLLDDPSEPPTC